MSVFKSKFRTYSISVLVDGKSYFASFHDLGKFVNESIFVTNDERVVSAMKKDPRYGEDYYSDDIDTEEEVTEPARVYDKVYDAIFRTQFAIDILVKEYGQKRSELKTKADVLKKADELNISFPKLA